MPYSNNNQELYNKITGFVIPLKKSLAEELNELEASMIERALNDYQGNQSKAAERLGMQRTTLAMKMKRHNIKVWLGKVYDE